jgi:hypothetical protein
MMAAAAHERRLDRVFRRRSHGATAKQYCPSSSTVARQRQLGARWVGAGALEQHGGLETAASADAAAE